MAGEKTIVAKGTDKPAGVYIAKKKVYMPVNGGAARVVEEGEFVSFDTAGQATKHFKPLNESGHNGISSGGDPRILNALKKLDPNNAAHWTEREGLPMVRVIETMISDPNITREDIENAWPGYNLRMAKAEEAKGIGQPEPGQAGQGKPSSERSKTDIGAV